MIKKTNRYIAYTNDIGLFFYSEISYFMDDKN